MGLNGLLVVVERERASPLEQLDGGGDCTPIGLLPSPFPLLLLGFELGLWISPEQERIAIPGTGSCRTAPWSWRTGTIPSSQRPDAGFFPPEQQVKCLRRNT